MSAIALLLILGLVSLLVTRVASIALMVTGMTQQSARFQARSALTGVGYTTTEAESIVNHPVRRRIVMALMLLGNIGLVAAMAGLLGGFVGAGGRQALLRVVLLIGGLAALYAASRSRRVDRVLSTGISKVLRRFTDLDVRDYANLLQLTGDYGVRELHVQPEDWLAGRRLDELRLADEGVLVLGIRRPDGRYLGAPDRKALVRANDTLVLYGYDKALDNLDERRAGREGDQEHRRLVAEQRRAARDEQADADDPPAGESPDGRVSDEDESTSENPHGPRSGD